MNLQYQILRNESEVNELCEKILTQEYITVDTEFFTNKKTKKFTLSLIQICCDGLNYLIDINDFIEIKNEKNHYIFPHKLKEIFENNQIIKVFHAYQQDYETLKNDLKIRLSNIFDTQIAMMFLHVEELYSYQTLVQEFLKIKIDKAHQMDNWQERPLTEEQIEYAIADVSYLYKIYPKIIEKLKRKNKLDWALSYMSELEKPKEKKPTSMDLIEKYNINISDKIKHCIIRELINFFHDHEIESFNLIKNIIEAKNLTINRLQHIFKNTQYHYLNEEHHQKILNIVQTEFSENDLKDICDLDNTKNELTYDQSHIFILLKYLLRKIAYKHQISPRLIAEKQDLLNLILNKNHKLNKNDWRQEIFGNFAINFLNGKINFFSKNSELFFDNK
jgi:ribonuclease D